MSGCDLTPLVGQSAFGEVRRYAAAGGWIVGNARFRAEAALCRGVEFIGVPIELSGRVRDRAIATPP